MNKLDMVLPVELLGLSDIKINEIYLRNKRELVIKVESIKDETICRNCGKICKPHGYDRAMELRHLPILGYKTYIQITPKRGTIARLPRNRFWQHPCAKIDSQTPRFNVLEPSGL